MVDLDIQGDAMTEKTAPDEIRIENDVPMPPDRPTWKKHVDKLNVGQSFRVEIRHWASLRNAATNQNRKGNKRYKTQKVKERPGPGKKVQDFARVWRVK